MTKATIVVAIALALLAGCSSGKSSGGGSPAPAGGTATGAAAGALATPNCNGESPVWTLERVKVYLLPGDRLYGKTRGGAYKCLSEAQAEGYRHGLGHRHHHHREQQVF